MDENESRSTGTSTGATGEQVMDQLRALRRSRDDKVIAGVCGGLGRSLGVDPLLLRVVAAVLVLFGGAGIVLYAIGWLVLPVDDGTPSVGAQAVDRGQHQPHSQTIWLAVVLAVAVVLGVIGAFGRWDGPILLSLAVVGLLVWLLRRANDQPVGGPRPGPSSPQTTAAPAPAPSTAAPNTATPRAATPSAATPSAATPSTTAPVQQPAYGWSPPPAPAPVAARPPKPKSHLFALTFSVVLIALGVLAAFDVSGFEPSAGAYPALALAVLALGLLVGAWFGRARGLIAWGLLLCLVTLVATVAGQARSLSGRTVDQRVTITTVDALPKSDEFGAGQVDYDLTGLDMAGRSSSMRAKIGFGEIVVEVPADLDVTVDARAGVGAVSLFGSSTGGLDERRTRTDYGADGPGGGTLDLTLYAGFGHVEVHRASS